MQNKTIKSLAWLYGFIIIFGSCSQNVDPNKIQVIDSTKLKNSKIEKTITSDTIEGRQVYESNCTVCHQPNGIGVTGIYPPLANSDYLLVDKKRALKNIIHGFKDSLKVNGKTYKGNIMPDFDLTDKQLKNVMNYILNSWGNKGGVIQIEDVKTAQKP